jgi:diacylglycerol kinase (ATP)
MKIIFVVNPNAGRVNRVQEIKDKLLPFQKEYDASVYETKSRGDAELFVREYLKTHSDQETYRFVACGGDGTLYDVVNGAVGFPNAEVGCMALGSGNDFVKNFHDLKVFQDVEKALKATPHPIDVLKVNGKYCVNITNFGFDGEVTFAQLRYKRWPFVSGPMAYKLAAVSSLLFKLNHRLTITVDDKVVFKGKGLLAIAANGYCYGGGFHCAPLAKIDDELIDFCIVRKISRFKAAGFMSSFRNGEHLTKEGIKEYVTYLRGKKAIFESDKDTAYAIDGEVFRKKRLEIELLPHALKFAVPSN